MQPLGAGKSPFIIQADMNNQEVVVRVVVYLVYSWYILLHREIYSFPEMNSSAVTAI